MGKISSLASAVKSRIAGTPILGWLASVLAFGNLQIQG